MLQTEFVFVYSTFPDAGSARRVAETLVERKLAACVNIHGPMTSFYEWEGKLTVDNEFAAFIKTSRAKSGEAIATAKPLHPYSVPCFLVLPIDGGNDDYLAWARGRVRAE
jgi:periplasmic divalent cation tolerance protein